MSRHILFAIIALAITCGAPSVGRGASIYTIIEYGPSNLNGFNVVGRIVTDGKTGALSATDITSWSYTVTGPESWSDTSTNYGVGPGAGVLIGGIVDASPTSISLPLSSESINNFYLGNEHNLTSESLIWTVSEISGSPEDDNLIGYAGGVLRFVSDNLGIPLGVAAAVPEPSSLTLTLIAVCALAGARCFIRRHQAGAVQAAVPSAHSNG
jgi:hypothetical protein